MRKNTAGPHLKMVYTNVGHKWASTGYVLVYNTFSFSTSMNFIVLLADLRAYLTTYSHSKFFTFQHFVESLSCQFSTRGLPLYHYFPTHRELLCNFTLPVIMDVFLWWWVMRWLSQQWRQTGKYHSVVLIYKCLSNLGMGGGALCV